MKYLKTFEKFVIKPVELKKYVIWAGSSYDRRSILEIISNDKYKSKLKRIYIYDFLKNAEIEIVGELYTDNIFEYTSGYVKENIVFESDNLQDCYDFLDMLKSSKIYNL